MKIKYLRLSKKERKEIRKEFYSTEKGKNLKNRLFLVFICAFVIDIIAFYCIIDNLLNRGEIWENIYAGGLLAISLFFYYNINRIHLTKVNNFTINKKVIK